MKNIGKNMSFDVFFYFPLQFGQATRGGEHESEEEPAESGAGSTSSRPRARHLSEASTQRFESPGSSRVASRVMSNPELKQTFMEVSNPKPYISDMFVDIVQLCIVITCI